MDENQVSPSQGGAQVLQWRPRSGSGLPQTAGPSGPPLRVLFIIDELDIGGTEQQILELVKRIDRERFEPHVCCFRYGRKAKEIASFGVPVHHEPKRMRADPGLILRLASLMKRERFDIVQTYLWTANTWGRLAARLAGVPIIVASERNVDIWEEAYKRVIGRWLARRTDCVVANSEAVRTYLLDRGGLDPDKVLTIYNGVNFERFRAPCDPQVRRQELGVPDDCILAGVVARVEPAKDHGTLLQAMSLIRDRAPKLHLVVVGGGSEEERLRRMTRELRIADRVHFTGFRTDAAEWLQSLDFSVLSSVKEGLSNSVIESMAAGRSIAATDVGGNAEVIIQEETGLLVPARDAPALANALARLCGSKELREKFGRAGQERVETVFAVASMVAHTEQLYRSLAERLKAAA
ncbi:MAG: glycosyltransferase [Candidatus Binatia bacterium]|nr:glycosyltransferase [Candidatus Binatia bacterium]